MYILWYISLLEMLRQPQPTNHRREKGPNLINKVVSRIRLIKCQKRAEERAREFLIM